MSSSGRHLAAAVAGVVLLALGIWLAFSGRGLIYGVLLISAEIGVAVWSLARWWSLKKGKR